MKPKCPFCKKEQRQKPIKSWTYGNVIEARTKSGTKWGAPVNVSRYSCKCDKSFNFYHTKKGTSWSIPKTKN